MGENLEIGIKTVRQLGRDVIADKMETCRHFTGIRSKCCDAGVQYADVAIEGEFKYRYGPKAPVYTVGRKWPCHRRDVEQFGVPACPKADWYTREEAEAEKAEIDSAIARTIGSRNAIVKHINETGDQAGVVECPACKGKLHYSRAEYNGHIHARCETENCVAWME